MVLMDKSTEDSDFGVAVGTAEDTMEVLYQRCAGLDLHKKTVVAAVRLVEGNKVVTEVRTFATTTAGAALGSFRRLARIVLDRPRCDPHDTDGVAGRVGGALLAFRSAGHR
jgi:hypothetical protein